MSNPVQCEAPSLRCQVSLFSLAFALPLSISVRALNTLQNRLQTAFERRNKEKLLSCLFVLNEFKFEIQNYCE